MNALDARHQLLHDMQLLLQELYRTADIADDDGLRLQAQLLVQLRQRMNAYAAGLQPGASSSQARILAYLQRFAGEPIPSEELCMIAGVHDAPRRIRDLRAAGYRIRSGKTASAFSAITDSYTLLNAAVDESRQELL
jgi:hypothetical protein